MIKVQINDKVEEFELYRDAQEHILTALRYMNNFEQSLSLYVQKTNTTQTDTLGIVVADSVDAKDIFGGE